MEREGVRLLEILDPTSVSTANLSTQPLLLPPSQPPTQFTSDDMQEIEEPCISVMMTLTPRKNLI